MTRDLWDNGLDSQGFFQRRKAQLGLESRRETFIAVVGLKPGLEDGWGWAGVGTGEKRALLAGWATAQREAPSYCPWDSEQKSS